MSIHKQARKDKEIRVQMSTQPLATVMASLIEHETLASGSAN